MTKKLNKQKDFQKRDIGHIFLLLSTSAGYIVYASTLFLFASTFSSEFRLHILHAASWKLRLNNIIYSVSHPFGITLILYMAEINIVRQSCNQHEYKPLLLVL